MRKQRIILSFIIGLLASFVVAETKTPVADRIEIKGGAILTGVILESEGEVIRLRTEYAGVLEVQSDKVQKVVSSKDLSGKVPDGVVVTKPVPPASVAGTTQQAKKPATPVTKPPESATKPAAVAAKPPAGKAPPAKKYGWEIEAGVDFNGSEGNTEKLDFSLNVDSKYLQKFYRLDLYARYNYGTNKDKLTSNEIILGSRYTNFFYKRFGWFVREELERDGFELIDFRSTTGSGFSYKILDNKSFDVEARSGLSYRFEEDNEGRQEDFPGMDFGMDVQWQFAPILTFKGTYAFIPSFNDADEYIMTQNSGLDIPISKNSNWKIRLGLTTKYNNKPLKNKERLDNKYYVRLIATWK